MLRRARPGRPISAVARQRSHDPQLSHKWGADKVLDPFEKEAKLRHIEPPPRLLDEHMRRWRNTYLDPQAAARAGISKPERGHYTRHIYKDQYKADKQNRLNLLRDQFAKDFMCWLSGTDPEDPKDPAYVRDAMKQLSGYTVKKGAKFRGEGVDEYLTSFLDKKSEFIKKYTRIRLGPHRAFIWNLGHYYLYYKYVLRNVPYTEDEILKDFDSFYPDLSAPRPGQVYRTLNGQQRVAGAHGQLEPHDDFCGIDYVDEQPQVQVKPEPPAAPLILTHKPDSNPAHSHPPPAIAPPPIPPAPQPDPAAALPPPPPDNKGKGPAAPDDDVPMNDPQVSTLPDVVPTHANQTPGASGSGTTAPPPLPPRPEPDATSQASPVQPPPDNSVTPMAISDPADPATSSQLVAYAPPQAPVAASQVASSNQLPAPPPAASGTVARTAASPRRDRGSLTVPGGIKTEDKVLRRMAKIYMQRQKAAQQLRNTAPMQIASPNALPAPPTQSTSTQLASPNKLQAPPPAPSTQIASPNALPAPPAQSTSTQLASPNQLPAPPSSSQMDLVPAKRVSDEPGRRKSIMDRNGAKRVEAVVKRQIQNRAAAIQQYRQQNPHLALPPTTMDLDQMQILPPPERLALPPPPEKSMITGKESDSLLKDKMMAQNTMDQAAESMPYFLETEQQSKLHGVKVYVDEGTRMSLALNSLTDEQLADSKLFTDDQVALLLRGALKIRAYMAELKKHEETEYLAPSAQALLPLTLATMKLQKAVDYRGLSRAMHEIEHGKSVEQHKKELVKRGKIYAPVKYKD